MNRPPADPRAVRDQIAPHDEAAEVSVLGGVLQDPAALLKAMQVLRPADFFKEGHRRIFGACVDLFERNEPVDLVMVTNVLIGRKELEQVGGSSEMARLVDLTPTTANVAHHARLVKKTANLRRIQDACTRTIEKARSNGADPASLVADLRDALEGIGPTEEASGSVVVCLADVTPESVSWLWRGRIAKGKLTLLIGDPGQGKSFLSQDLGARISAGAPWPDGGMAPAGDVILLTAEDGLGDTVRPRFDAMGGDPARVHVLTAIREAGGERGFDLSRDLGALEVVVRQRAATLVVIDPVSAYLGKTDSFKDSEVRGVLAPVAALAERTGVAVMGIMHLTKNQQRQALYRAQGSLAFVAAARAVFAVAEDPLNPERRLFVPVKLNIARKPPGLAFRLAESGTVGRVEWDADPVMMSADEALAVPEPPEEQSEREEAMDFLREVLGDGPVAAEELKRQARAAGISERTLFRAKADLGIGAKKTEFKGKWEWHLPTKTATKGATDEHVAIFGEDQRSSTDKHGVPPKTATLPLPGSLGGTLRGPEPPAEVEL